MDLSLTRLIDRIILSGLVLTTLFMLGCSRRHYRIRADRQANELIGSRQVDPSWQLPVRDVIPDPRSRMADANDPDCGNRPLDDPSAKTLMERPHRFNNSRHWTRIPEDHEIDDDSWRDQLSRDQNGDVIVTRESAVSLALVHSREYQDEYEAVYLSALELSNTRFFFDTQLASGSTTNYFADGEAASGARLLSQSLANGFSRNMAAGGQLLTSMVNRFSWNLTSGGISAAGGSLVFALTQPLLRGASQFVGLEPLTQSERELLYVVRSFARFRRQFYLNIVADYLRLLSQSQNLKNQRANLESLELNFREHEALEEKEMVPRIQVDQVFQQYQSGRISVLSSEQSLQDSMDAFKFTLGLPPSVPLKLDESLLKLFVLNDPKLDKIQDEIDKLFLQVLQFLPPDPFPANESDKAIAELEKLERRLAKLLPSMLEEYERWQNKLNAGLPEHAMREEKIDFDQQKSIAKRIRETLEQLKTDLSDLDSSQQKRRSEVAALAGDDRWQRVSDEIGKHFRKMATRFFVAQTQIRLFLIDITRFDLDSASAVKIGLANRLDLKNQRARVTDAYRQVELAANNLQSDLSVGGTATLNTDPNKNNAAGFDANHNNYQLNVQFDGPLNRRIERNSYRSAQIAYQQARRSYMATEDSVANQIRSDMRRLRISWLNFQISRQQLIAALRQVDEAQFNLRNTTQASSNLTRDLLDALSGLLDARNSLIGNWIAYEISRITLFVNLELLYLNEEGNWINQDRNPVLEDDWQLLDFPLQNYLPKSEQRKNLVDRNEFAESQPTRNHGIAPRDGSDVGTRIQIRRIDSGQSQRPLRFGKLLDRIGR